MAKKVILIVEDEFLIAHSLRDWLEAAGYETVGPVTTVAEALSTIETHKLDAAILDVKLADGPAEAVASKLAQSGIPFAAFTGYPSGALGPAYAGIPIVPKPCRADQIVATVEQLLRR